MVEKTLNICLGNFGRIILTDIDRTMAPHVHRHCHILLKAGGRDATFTTAGKSYPFTNSNILMINPWESHNINIDAEGDSVTVLALYLEPNWLNELAENKVRKFFPVPYTLMTDRLNQLRNQLIECLSSNETANKADIESLCYNFANALLQFHPVSNRKELLPSSDQRMWQAVDIIDQSFGDVGEMGAIAREIGVSRPRFFARFKSFMGTTPTLYANSVRVETAVQELELLHTNIIDLSLALGFSDQGNFTRFFRKHLGNPPAVFRSALRSQPKIIR